MGHLQYGTASQLIEVEDRALAHLQIVILSKLRRNERFSLSLRSPRPDSPLTVLWMSASVPLSFNYSLSTPNRVNPAWVHLLAEAAASNTGLRLIPEEETLSAVTARAERRDKVTA